MAKFVMRNATISVNGVDLSANCSAITVENTTDEVDVTSFGGSNYRSFLPGFLDAQITSTFFQNFGTATGELVDATLWPLNQSGGTFDVVVKPTSSAASPTNPSYTLRASLFNFNPMGGAVGDAASTDVTFRNAGTAGLVRGTA